MPSVSKMTTVVPHCLPEDDERELHGAFNHSAERGPNRKVTVRAAR